MKRYVYTTVIGFLLLSGKAFATPDFVPPGLAKQDQSQGQAQSANAAAGAIAGSVAVSGSNSTSASGASNYVKTGPTYAAGGDVDNKVSASNGSQTVNFNTPANTRARLENVPNAVAGNIYPTATCMNVSSVGGAGVGFGFSVGTSWTAEECQIGETARGFEQAGYKEDAMAVRCQGKYAAIAPSCKKLIKE